MVEGWGLPQTYPLEVEPRNPPETLMTSGVMVDHNNRRIGVSVGFSVIADVLSGGRLYPVANKPKTRDKCVRIDYPGPER